MDDPEQPKDIANRSEPRQNIRTPEHYTRRSEFEDYEIEEAYIGTTRKVTFRRPTERPSIIDSPRRVTTSEQTLGSSSSNTSEKDDRSIGEIPQRNTNVSSNKSTENIHKVLSSDDQAVTQSPSDLPNLSPQTKHHFESLTKSWDAGLPDELASRPNDNKMGKNKELPPLPVPTATFPAKPTKSQLPLRSTGLRIKKSFHNLKEWGKEMATKRDVKRQTEKKETPED